MADYLRSQETSNGNKLVILLDAAYLSAASLSVNALYNTANLVMRNLGYEPQINFDD